MNRKKVTSSNIDSIGYDLTSLTLEVEFKNGSMYQYFKVPLKIYKKLMVATSHGKFLNTYIKNGGYPFKKIR